MTDTVIMYRPIGPMELQLVSASGFRRWPPRLPAQPILYVATNERYAIEIATRWNIKDSGIGYVTRFAVGTSFVDRYVIQEVGHAYQSEWWIPDQDLEELNDNIVGLIEVTGEYR